MSDASTKTMLRPFIEKAPDPMFLMGFFQAPPENYYTSQSVEIDIQRDGEDVAVAITDLANGQRYNESTVGSNKEFTPPVFKEVGSLNGFQLLTREFGDNPFQSRPFQAKATLRTGLLSAKMQSKINRSVEWMCSQILQTGLCTLTDSSGTGVFSIDFLAKGTHFVTTTPWAADGTTGDPWADIDSLARVIRKDGRRSPDTLLLGSDAQTRFLANPRLQKLLTYDGFYGATGAPQLAPERPGVEGSNFLGNITINNYRYKIYGYDGRYNNPQTGVSTPYVADNKVIVMSSKARMDLTFGAIPMIAPPEGRVLQFLPPRVSDGSHLMDMIVNAWVSPDGQTLNVSVSSRPLAIPTEIDSYGCLTVL
jgi:hypothetical protein